MKISCLLNIGSKTCPSLNLSTLDTFSYGSLEFKEHEQEHYMVRNMISFDHKFDINCVAMVKQQPKEVVLGTK